MLRDIGGSRHETQYRAGDVIAIIVEKYWDGNEASQCIGVHLDKSLRVSGQDSFSRGTFKTISAEEAHAVVRSELFERSDLGPYSFFLHLLLFALSENPYPFAEHDA